jgi:hypothetical protein
VNRRGLERKYSTYCEFFLKKGKSAKGMSMQRFSL